MSVETTTVCRCDVCGEPDAQCARVYALPSAEGEPAPSHLCTVCTLALIRFTEALRDKYASRRGRGGDQRA